MRGRSCVLSLAGFALAAGVVTIVPTSFGILGVTPAHAAEFYTRKRVNGQWITGRFPKEGSDTSRRASGSRVASLSARTTDVDRPDMASVPLPPASPNAAAAAEAWAAYTPVEAAEESSETADERMTRLRDALKAKAVAIASSVSATIAPSMTVPPRAELVASLDALPTAAPLPVAAPVATSVSRNPLEPRSVLYDFETGVKTTSFENSVVREPFDVVAMRAVMRSAGR